MGFGGTAGGVGKLQILPGNFSFWDFRTEVGEPAVGLGTDMGMYGDLISRNFWC